MSDEHFKFHKVVSRHYSREVVNVYIILWQIYLGNSLYGISSKSPKFYRRY